MSIEKKRRKDHFDSIIRDHLHGKFFYTIETLYDNNGVIMARILRVFNPPGLFTPPLFSNKDMAKLKDILSEKYHLHFTYNTHRWWDSEDRMNIPPIRYSITIYDAEEPDIDLNPDPELILEVP